MNLKSTLISIACICVSGSVYSGETRSYYKTYDENGTVIYTDVKPISDQPAQEVVISKDINVIQSNLDLYSPSSSQLLGQDTTNSQFGITPEQFEVLTDEEKQYLIDNGYYTPPKIESQKAEPTQISYEDALKAQEQGKEPRISDWQHTVKGRRFLKPEYFERQKKLQDQVDQAKGQ